MGGGSRIPFVAVRVQWSLKNREAAKSNSQGGVAKR